MYPRLYMQSFQYVVYNCTKEIVTFETRYANGQLHYFNLTRTQFLNFHDAVLLIERDNSYGHYPLGRGTWLHYNAFDASLYRDARNEKRIDFLFASFGEYMRYTHRRLFSLVRRKEPKTDGTRQQQQTRRRQQSNGRRWRGRSTRGGGKQCEIISSINKRPLPTAIQSENRSPTAKRPCWEDSQIASWTSDNVELSDDDEASAVLPKWHHPITRRRRDTLSSASSLSKSASTTDASNVQQLFSPSNRIVEMET